MWSGCSDKDKMKTSDSDRVIVMGLLLSSDLLEYVGYVMPLKSTKPRSLFDGYASGKLRAISLLYQKFIDK